MRIGFIEKMAAQTMASKNLSRNAALKRLTLVWAFIGLACGAIAMFAPVDDISITRRSSEAPLGFILWGVFVMMMLLAALCSGSIDKE